MKNEEDHQQHQKKKKKKKKIYIYIGRKCQRKSNYKKSFGTIYDVKSVNDIEGNEFDFSKLKGKTLFIINTACKCGKTKKSFQMMNELRKKYKDKLEVLAFLNFVKQRQLIILRIEKFLRNE